MSDIWGDSGWFTLSSSTDSATYTDSLEQRYRRHLLAIFREPCRCFEWRCWLCLYTLAKYRIWDACPKHIDTCQACIAEHALYAAWDHRKVEGRR